MFGGHGLFSALWQHSCCDADHYEIPYGCHKLGFPEKKKPFGPPQIFFMYHVQFFGEEAERAWVSESAVIPYEGVNAFHELCREMSVKTKSNKAK